MTLKELRVKLAEIDCQEDVEVIVRGFVIISGIDNVCLDHNHSDGSLFVAIDLDD